MILILIFIIIFLLMFVMWCMFKISSQEDELEEERLRKSLIQKEKNNVK